MVDVNLLNARKVLAERADRIHKSEFTGFRFGWLKPIDTDSLCLLK